VLFRFQGRFKKIMAYSHLFWDRWKVNARSATRPLITLLIVTLGAHSLVGSPVSIGVLSFNTLIPSAPGLPGVDDFEIDNLTASFALPPDFPVSNSLILDNTTFSITFGDGTQQSFNLGNLSPGSYTPTPLQFSASSTISSAILSATLNQTSIQLNNGTSYQIPAASIMVSLTDQSGSLVPDTDFALINISGPTVSTVPEPATSFLFAIAALLVCSKRRFWAFRR
jgi:hypothetical protein